MHYRHALVNIECKIPLSLGPNVELPRSHVMQETHLAILPAEFQRASAAALVIGGLLLSGCTTTSADGAGDSAAKAPPPTTQSATVAPPAAADDMASKGEQCREFQRTVTIGGKTETAYGTACRQPNGSWKQEDELSPAPRRQAAAPPDRSFPYKGYPQRHFSPGYAPFYLGLGVGNGGGSVGYGVGF